MSLRKIGKARVVTATKETNLEDAARLMRENHVGDVVIVEIRGGKKIPVGILTDRDIVMAAVAMGAPTAKLSAGDVMTTDIASVNERGSLTEVIDLMKERGVKRVPILGKDKELVGIIALEDVMNLLGSELSALAAVSREQKELELERRRNFA